MKKTMVIDGGPRRDMNTAAMIAAFVEGVHEGGGEAKVVRLYDLDYKGCRSCMITNMALSHEIGREAEVVLANNTMQVKDYSKYNFAEGTSGAKQGWHDKHWEEDMKKAKEIGKGMASDKI